MMNLNEAARTTGNRRTTAPLLLALLALLAPSAAHAYLMTLTFDDGAYDETITYPPGGEIHGPFDWVESNGIRAAGWWATNVGTASGAYQQGHTHIQPNWSGRPDGRYEGMHAWTDDLQGLEISLESGASFDLVSIDYSILVRDYVGDPYTERLPWSWGPGEAQLLLSSTGFDPAASDFQSQWTAIPIDDFGNPYYPWFTQTITGFDNLTSFMLSQTLGSVGIDSIVIDVHPMPVPEPSAALLIGLGLAGLASRKSSRD